jgi:hypothetical protein
VVRADAVRQMLGLADRTRVIDLFEQLARGDIAGAFREFREQYDTGADPIVVLSDLAEFVNFVTRVKIVPATADNVAFGETERLRARDFAAKLSMRVLSRMWQMLLKWCWCASPMSPTCRRRMRRSGCSSRMAAPRRRLQEMACRAARRPRALLRCSPRPRAHRPRRGPRSSHLRARR